MIFVENKRKAIENLTKTYRDAKIIDVTSKAEETFVKFSPFYPHGNIPVPFSNLYSFSVEGIWQGLKVFEAQDVDIGKFKIRDMKGLKRTSSKFGKTLGHRKGIDGGELIDYITARKQIYLPSYYYVLETRLVDEIILLRNIALRQDIVLLDYETNGDIEDASKPLSHAYLIKKFLEEKYLVDAKVHQEK